MVIDALCFILFFVNKVKQYFTVFNCILHVAKNDSHSLCMKKADQLFLLFVTTRRSCSKISSVVSIQRKGSELRGGRSGGAAGAVLHSHWSACSRPGSVTEGPVSVRSDEQLPNRS